MAKQAAAKVSSVAQRGVVVKFDAEKGFGFIRPQGPNGQGAQDVFVHIRNVEGRKTLHPGQSVTYYVTPTDKGPSAIKVKAGSLWTMPYLKFTLVGLGSALLLLLGLTAAFGAKQSLALWLALWVTAVSIASFGIYGYDKAQAQAGGGRVPEAVLHGLSLVGGSPGSFAAMRVFHHKTSKTSFQVVFWLIVALQVAALSYWVLEG